MSNTEEMYFEIPLLLQSRPKSKVEKIIENYMVKTKNELVEEIKKVNEKKVGKLLPVTGNKRKLAEHLVFSSHHIIPEPKKLRITNEKWVEYKSTLVWDLSQRITRKLIGGMYQCEYASAVGT